MERRYKIILSSKKLYTEVELSPEMRQVKVGTGMDCDVRLHRNLFFEQIELTFSKSGDNWSVFCADTLYLSVGDVRKLMTLQLSHGASFAVRYLDSDSVAFSVDFMIDFDHEEKLYDIQIALSGCGGLSIGRYQDSDTDAFTVDFMIDFDHEEKLYDIQIDLSGCGGLSIGGSPDADIQIEDETIGQDHLQLQIGERIFVVDDGSRYGIYVNGVRVSGKKELHDYDFFSIASYSFFYKKGKLYTASAPAMRLNGLTASPVSPQSSHFKYPNFVRSTRVQYCLPEDEIELQQPPPKPQRPRKNLLLSLIPSVTMLAMMVILRGIMGNGGLFVVYSVCSMGIGIVMSIVTYHMDGREYRRDAAKREEDYRGYIANKEAEIQATRDNELRIRGLIYEPLSHSIQEVESYGKRIFERSAADQDFLKAYLGAGTVESVIPVKYTKQEFADMEDPISTLPEEVGKKYRNLEDAPIVSDFAESGGVGVVGPQPDLSGMMKNLSLDIAIRHFYKEVKFYYLLKDDSAEDVKWIKWLRHAYNDELGIRNIMCDEESRKLLLENLYAILSDRESQMAENNTIQFGVHYVVFVMVAAPIRQHPISQYLEKCSQYGFTFIFFEEHEEFLPRGCGEIVRLDGSGRAGALVRSANGDTQTPFIYESVSAELARSVALRLGAICVKEANLASEMTRSITLFQLLGIFSTNDLNLGERWEKSKVYRSIAAPLGVKMKNEVVYLDIGDKSNAHGPHGLVAGTTGSGKSELLQTYVLSVATLFHPYDVGFVIIDFKGGGMANQFKDLPHMMGAITNIDGREIDRSLLSIKAELMKRQARFAEAGVNHINDYVRLFKNGAVREPLPHMIIIVDEFAELKQEYPDFMKELISAARIGRTLGIHLILATQKPAGVVDAQIWSNSKFKLCLKVQTKEDSNEVIKTPLAAEIVEPGRAYFQVGNNEIFELFQSAYSGAKVQDAEESKSMSYSIWELNEWGKRREVYTNRRGGQNDLAKSQLQALVEYIDTYFKVNQIEKLGGICLPPLPDMILRGGLRPFSRPENRRIVVPVGVYDDPERQEQGNYCLDLSDSNTYIVGSAMTGKTTLLQTILLQLMKFYTPEDVNVYIIDCGNMTLKNFEESNLVGGVALTEEEKVHNLFKLLLNTVEQRKKRLAQEGLGTHRAYLEAGYTDMPQIVLMIDNLAAFREYYDGLQDGLLALSREGNSVGISLIATASQTNAMNYKALSNYGTRLAFVCNDTGEYNSLFDRCRMVPKDTAGRGLCMIDKRILEFQTALGVEGTKEIERVQNIKQEIAAFNARCAGITAQGIPIVPEVIRFSKVKDNREIYQNAYQIPMGIRYATVEYAMLNIAEIGLLATLGRERSGKTNFIQHLFAAIQNNLFGSLTEAYVVDSGRRTLGFTREYGFVEAYTADLVEAEEYIERIETQLQERQSAMADNPEYALSEEPLLLLVIENPQFFAALQNNKGLSAKLTQMVKEYRRCKFTVILSAVENASVPFSAPEFVKFVKDNKRFLVFDELSEVKFFDITVRQTKENAKPLKLGDAFLCMGGEVDRIKTICMEES